MLVQTETTELHMMGSDLRSCELLEPLSEQSLSKTKSRVSALVTWELSEGNIGFVQLGKMITSGSQWHGNLASYLIVKAVGMASVPSLDRRYSGQPEHLGCVVGVK